MQASKLTFQEKFRGEFPKSQKVLMFSSMSVKQGEPG